MKYIIADSYTFYIHNSKNVIFPKKFRDYKIIWNMREALLILWQGEVTTIAIPKLGTPGYDFPNFIQDMMKIGQIKSRPKFEYYELNIVRKN